MNLPVYILSAVLLSWVGALGYLALRRLRPGLRSRKFLIWTAIILSLSLPFTLSPRIGNIAGVAQINSQQTAESVHEFCHCADPNAGDVLLYQTHQIYDFLLSNTATINLIFLLTGCFFVGLALLRLFAVSRLLHKKKPQDLDLEGHKLRILRGVSRIAAGSLRWGHKYIIWHEELDALPEKEQKAILWHELSHIRQLNTYEKVFLGFLQAIWFFNPAFYLFRGELENISEYIADDYAVRKSGNPRAYAALILKIKSSKSFAPVQFFRRGQIRSRIERLVGVRSEKPRLGIIPVLFLGLFFIFAGEFYAQNLIKSQIQEIEVYEFLSRNHQESGKEEFCKKCTYEALGCYYEPLDCYEE